MNFKFTGDVEQLLAGIDILAGDYGCARSEDGMPVEVSRGENLFVALKNGAARIRYSRPCEFFRALSILLQRLSSGETEFEVSETSFFDTCGAMIDLSHGALMTVDAIKSVLRKMAVMGLNMFMLYREESYVVPEYEYFGYMRGRHTDEEIREIDDYAWQLGIEIIPAIQTLGHLSNTLRWSQFSDVKDTGDCLLVGEEKTYDFIESMVKAAIRPLRSKRIHIGFDETMSLGLGNYILKNGYRPRMDIFCEHLQRVAKIVEKYDLEPMVWSDMFFRTGGSMDSYALDSLRIPPEVIKRIPANIELVEANYSLTDEEQCCERFHAHLETGRKTWFAGAVHDWHGFCTNYYHTVQASNAALSAAKKGQIKNVFATTWGDDSPERDFFCNLLGFQLYAEHMYHRAPTLDDVKQRFDFCGKCSSEMILEIANIDNPEHIESGSAFIDGEIIPDSPKELVNPSKYLMWQDPIAGLFDTEAAKLDFEAHFIRQKEELQSFTGKYPEFETTLEFYIALCDVLSVKCGFGLRLKQYYDEKNEEKLREVVDREIPLLLQKTEKLWLVNRKLWFERHCAFGFEVLERRYGCLMLRLKTTSYRISEFLAGRIGKIEELEEKRLPATRQTEHVAYFNDYLLTHTAWGR